MKEFIPDMCHALTTMSWLLHIHLRPSVEHKVDEMKCINYNSTQLETIESLPSLLFNKKTLAINDARSAQVGQPSGLIFLAM